MIEAAQKNKPGQVVGIGAGEVVVALNEGTLKIGKVKAEKGAKLDADEFAKEAGLKVGMRFGT